MISTHYPSKNNIAIFIGSGFAECEAVYCLSQMRTAGLPVSLVGLSSKLIHSLHGLAVQPDFSLNEPSNHIFSFIIIPGYYESVANLLTSPNFYEQITRNMAQEGYIGIFANAKNALQQAKLLETQSKRILLQAEQPLDIFCKKLTEVANSARKN